MIGTYERIAETLLQGQPKPRKIARFVDGKLLTGTASLHKTPQSRRWNLFWRLKYNRSK
jgi:hypothetical protein